MVKEVKVEKKEKSILTTLVKAAEFEKPAVVDLIKEGTMTKISGAGNETLYHFTLTSKALTYTELSNIGNAEKLRYYELVKTMAL